MSSACVSTNIHKSANIDEIQKISFAHFRVFQPSLFCKNYVNSNILFLWRMLNTYSNKVLFFFGWSETGLRIWTNCVAHSILHRSLLIFISFYAKMRWMKWSIDSIYIFFNKCVRYGNFRRSFTAALCGQSTRVVLITKTRSSVWTPTSSWNCVGLTRMDLDFVSKHILFKPKLQDYKCFTNSIGPIA